MDLGSKANFENRFKKGMAAALTGVLLLSGAVFAFATETGGAGVYAASAVPPGAKVSVYVKPDVTIVVKGEEKIFLDVNGRVVFPVIYNGSTYLPVRAISGLMEEDIEWDEYSKTVFMGKTFTNPNKVKHPLETTHVVTPGAVSLTRPDPSMAFAYTRPNFLIMYDFEMQLFYDEQNQRVYPLVLNGSTYLPIRAVSALMKETIDWDGLNKTITIGTAEEPVAPKSEATNALVSQFEKQVMLYDSATVKIKNLQKAASGSELLVIATEISRDYALAAENTMVVKGMDTAGYTEKELEAYVSLVEFTQISEHYVLVLENIAYMAAAEQDYSMLAETFLTFAMESQGKLDQTRAFVEAL